MSSPLRSRLSGYFSRRRERARERREFRKSVPPPRKILLEDWKGIIAGAWHDFEKEDLFLLAAAVAFFSFLSLFPGLTLFVSIYGLIADPLAVNQQLMEARQVLPAAGRDIIERQVIALTESPKPGLGISIGVSALLGLWTSMRGTRALILACNRVYGSEERRSVLALNWVTLVLTLFGLVYATITVLLLVLMPALFQVLPRAPFTSLIIDLTRWPLLAVLMMTFLSALYRYAPSRPYTDPRWVSWGSAIATVLWLAISVGFTTFVANFGSYNRIYGTLSGVVVSLLWLYFSALCILIGALVNVQIRTQARRRRREVQEAARAAEAEVSPTGDPRDGGVAEARGNAT